MWKNMSLGEFANVAADKEFTNVAILESTDKILLRFKITVTLTKLVYF